RGQDKKRAPKTAVPSRNGDRRWLPIAGTGHRQSRRVRGQPSPGHIIFLRYSTKAPLGDAQYVSSVNWPATAMVSETSCSAEARGRQEGSFWVWSSVAIAASATAEAFVKHALTFPSESGGIEPANWKAYFSAST